jgi:uncharacterized protein YfbU (UPF0304 family)
VIGFFESVSDIREDFPDFNESLIINNLEKANEIVKEINSLVDHQFRKAEDYKLDKIFPDLTDSINSFVSAFDKTLIQEQSIERFTENTQDTFLLKNFKKIKHKFYNFSSTSVRVRNNIAAKFNKPGVEIKRWKQIIPQRNLAYFFFRDKLLKEFAELYNHTCRTISINSVLFLEYDANIDYTFLNNFVPPKNRLQIKSSGYSPAQLIKKLEDLKKEITERINGLIDECILEFVEACEKAGTIELNRHKFRDAKIRSVNQKVVSGFEQLIAEWDNNHFALGEEWKLNYDFESVRYSVLRAFYKLDKSIAVRMKIQINPPFNSATETLNKVFLELSKEKTENESFIRKLKIAKEDIHSELSGSTLPGLINTITDMQIPQLLDDTLTGIKKIFDDVVGVRTFRVEADYSVPLSSDSLNPIYPGEFLSFKALPVITENFSKIKEEFIHELKNIQSELINLGNMVDFSIESGISAFNTKEMKEQELKEIVIEGIKISLDKNEKIKNDYQAICENSLRRVLETLILFNAETFKFNNKGDLLASDQRVSESKLKFRTLETDKTQKPSSIKTRENLDDDHERSRNLSEVLENLRTHSGEFGLTGLNNGNSDFMKKSIFAMERLPYIYKRLFQISALEHNRLYLRRELEESQLQNAFKVWLSGGFAPVIVTSERGGGKTTFINLNLSRFAEQFSTTRIRINPTIYTIEDLLDVLKPIVNIETLSDYSEIIELLNKSATRRIIVIENLQHLFLRTVNGFNAIKVFLEIITKTSKNVFWITSSSSFAFEYLKKSIHIDDFFGYHINLADVGYEHMIDLIKKRHALSGFSLLYVPDLNGESKKDMSKIEDSEYQISLERKYFKSLSLLAGSNISLALLFWLSSIIKIMERTLYLSAELEISNTLLSSLSSEKIFILQSLILHDELKLTDLNKILNYSIYETTLLMQVLTDEGIVTKSENIYFINPLIYRQTAALLKSKNFLD